MGDNDAMAARFTDLVIDSRDHHALAAFWCEVLGYSVASSKDGPKYWYTQIAGPDGSGPALLFYKQNGEKTVKNRVHIDVNPTDRDQEAEVERLLALGATRADIGQSETPWVVLADPEGNEFCVLPNRVDPLT